MRYVLIVVALVLAAFPAWAQTPPPAAYTVAVDKSTADAFVMVLWVVGWLGSVAVAFHIGRWYVNHKLAGMSPADIVAEIKGNSRAAEVVHTAETALTVDQLKPYIGLIVDTIKKEVAKVTPPSVPPPA